MAHISDLHFSKLTWEPSQLFSKRWIGNLNLATLRKYTLQPESLTTLCPLFHAHGVQAVLITGDLSCTSHEKEFEVAKNFVETLEREKLKVFVLPGNHDHYTKNAYKKKTFYQFFASHYDSLSALSLKKDGMTALYLDHNWWLIALDTALATNLFSSNGYFSFELEKTLEKTLHEIPSGHSVILANHFPIFANESERKSLLRREALKSLLERFSKIRLFLHGHTHRHSIADLRASNLPIILDSGSASHKKNGSWNLIDISTSGCEVEVFKKNPASSIWERTHTQQFKW